MPADAVEPRTLSVSLSIAIDHCEAQIQRARELGWEVIAKVFERARAELIDLIPADELGR